MVDYAIRPVEVGVPPDPRPAPTLSTQKLSAAPYLSDFFRHSALRHVVYQRQRHLAPSYDFDLPTVARHCRRAHRLALYRDLVFCTAAVAALLVAGPLWMLAVGVVAATYCAFVGLPGTYRALSLKTTDRWSFRIAQRVARHSSGRLALVWVVLTLALLLLPHRLLSTATAGPSGVRLGLLAGAVVTVAIATALWRWHLLRTIATGTDRAGPPIALGPTGVQATPVDDLDAEEELAARPGHGRLKADRLDDEVLAADRPSAVRRHEPPLVVRYSQDINGSGRPFQGAGVPIPGTRVEVVLKADEQATDPDARPPLPPTAAQLIDGMRDELQAMTEDTLGQAPGLRVSEQLIRTGRLIGRPTEVARLNRRRTTVINDGGRLTRHFLVCQLASTAPEISGEVIVTLFVHLTVAGDTLVLSLEPCVLLETDERFGRVRDPRFLLPTSWLPDVVTALARLPRDLIAAPTRLRESLLTSARGLLNAAFYHAGPGRYTDVGAIASIRELGEGWIRPDHFLFSLAEDYLALLTKRVPVALSTVLSRYGMDTKDLSWAVARLTNISLKVSGNLNVEGSVRIGGHTYKAQGG